MDWSCAEREFITDPEVVDVLGAKDTFLCTYQRAGTSWPVSVYVGYHDTQVRKAGGGLSRSAIHTPKHCLPGAGWDVIGSETVRPGLSGLPADAEVNRLVIAKGDLRQIVYYWYHSRGHVIADDYQKISHLFWDRATRSRTDGALVRLTVPVKRGHEEPAEESLREVADHVVAQLPRYVPD